LNLLAVHMFPYHLVSQSSQKTCSVFLEVCSQVTSVVTVDWASTLGNLRFWKMHESGGHFAAWERPEELVSDIREFYGPGGGAAGVVKQ
jgi:hypothetical protein